MSLNPLFFVSMDLEEYLVDNDSGAPLSNGYIQFWKDDDRTVPKSVYELTGAPPNYTYTALPNPVILSAVGTPVDNSGNSVSLYYFPYDADGNIELYFIQVYDSNGTLQFSRQAWPNITSSTNPAEADADISNELSNPQFVEINFALSNPMTITISGAGTTVSSVAPKWDLVTTTTGAATVIVTRNAVTGTSAYPSNPPYTLTVTGGSNISALVLRQRLYNNPDIFAPAVGGANGYISASVLLAPNSSAIMQYQPNGQVAQTLLSASNVSGLYEQFNATVQLSAANNSNNGDTGYVDILVNLSASGTTTLSNLQIIGLESDVASVGFDQTAANRQRDQLFNYYESPLMAKQIPSYLIGWNFPQNPAQFLGPTIAASSAGANTSAYKWDQTILFQSVNSGAAVSRASSGALRVTATNATQFALIQYLPAADAKLILNQAMSVNVAALSPQIGGIVGTVGLYYTKDVSLPSTASNNSIVATLGSTGIPLTFNGNWTEVPRSGLGPAKFTVGSSSTTNFNDYGLNGWDMLGAADSSLATFFAVVVGFATLNLAGTIDISSISLVPGSIPCRPGIQSDSAVLQDCQRYYSSSFNAGVVPGATLGTSAGVVSIVSVGNVLAGGFFEFPVSMRSTPTVTLYNPINNNAQFYSVSASSDCSSTATGIINQNGFQMVTTTANTGQNVNVGGFSADARLGL
jgi:hypothetical protein